MDDLKQEVSEFLKGGIEFEGALLKASVEIRERSKEAYGRLLDARLVLMAVANELSHLKELVPGKTDANISERLLLTTVFFQGVYAMETLVSEGQYTKAAAALKQDLEIVARLGEIAAGTHRYGKTPNVKYAPPGSQLYYGQLNDVAHIAKSNLLHDLVSSHVDGSIRGVSPIPRFHPDVARELYELHVWLLFQVCRERVVLYLDMYGEANNDIGRAFRWIVNATEILREVGWKVEDSQA